MMHFQTEIILHDINSFTFAYLYANSIYYYVYVNKNDVSLIFSSLENVAGHCWKNINRVTMNRDEPSRTCPVCSWQSGAEINMPSVLVKQLLTDESLVREDGVGGEPYVTANE